MEKEREETMEQNHPSRTLNFNAPLLSTRRLGNPPTTLQISCTNLASRNTSSSDRIPFSWEQAPGKPKDFDTRDDHDQETTPPPKLPPSWWRPPPIQSTEKGHQNYYCDDGFDGDVDIDDNELDDIGDVDVFSDAIDVFSLSEAIDIVEKSQKMDAVDGLKLKLAECRGEVTPNFIIQRFLPDATALAASSSALSISKNGGLNYEEEEEASYSESSSGRAVMRRQSYSPPKGCGLELLFPWRMKHKLCGVKSPVRHASSTGLWLESL
ncbi:hypothetical protein FEM48_Zijuj06G0060400 [Ziziphus jujuba var. spinosa]|uniref:Uncharacterized protein n=1 Tax=Ziziphus jujuba var. spinosa TaxID=714518 RepID=A0A978V7K8_ZIZJJ|nr:hypothetical protein FEM48_Zijuj06G0060400 [Ziziphus jujuba var. spinosa]